jgi:hypothetical protein
VGPRREDKGDWSSPGEGITTTSASTPAAPTAGVDRGSSECDGSAV